MSASSILIDCHIARTLGSSQKEIEAYTAVRYALRCGGSSVGQVLDALKELELMRPWSRVASLSDLCRLSRSKTPAIANAIHESIFPTLLEACPEFLRPSLTNCLIELSETSATDILKHVRELSALLTAKFTQDEPDKTLFSLERNEEVSLLLAILEIVVADSPEEITELLSGGSDTGGQGGGLLDFIDRCLDGDFGRTQLLQALDVCLEMGELDRARICINALQVKIEQDVDLLHRHARLAYLSSPDANRGDVAAWATKELQLFGTLQQVSGGTLDGQLRAHKLRAAALWQDAVIGTAIAHGQFSSTIGKIFKPRIIDIPAEIALSLHVSPRHRKLTANLYLDLLWEAGESVNDVRFSRSGLPASYGIVPWFYADRKRMRPRRPWLPHTASLYVRMASWAIAACNLLTSQPIFDTEDEGTKYLGYYLLHVYHWFDALERAVRNGRIEIEEEIYQVASAARLIIEQVVGGRYEDPAPAFFVQLTILATETGFFSGTSSEIDFENIFRKQDSIDRQLETALVLAQRALAVTEDAPRAGRWLEDAGNVSNLAIAWFEGRNRFPIRPQYIALCFKRFFEKETHPNNAQEPMEDVHRSGTWTSLYGKHRAVLLMDADRYLDWICGEEQIPLSESGYAAPLTVAVQRVVAAMTDPSTPFDLRDKWLADFRRLLSAANKLLDFDRFLQCRFVEVLKMRILRDEADLIAMIISRLLEFGSNYTFSTLIQWLQKDPVESDMDASLRIQIFDTLSRYIRALESARARSEEPQNPESRAHHTARAFVLERLAAASLTLPLQAGQVVNAAILVAAREKRDAVLARPLEDLGASISAEVDDSGIILPLSRDYAAQDLRTATLVAFDATRLTLKRLGPPQHGPDGRNLFADATPNPRFNQSYLGMVVTANASDTMISFDASSQAVSLTGSPLTLQQGQLVSAECGPFATAKFASSPINAIREIGQVHRNEHWTVSVETRTDSLGLGFYARSPSGKGFWITTQTTNLLAIFSLRPEITSFDIRFAIDQDGERANPAVGRFTDLLLDEAAQFDGNTDIVLCLRSIVRSEHGTISEIEVETMPFRRYRLRFQSDIAISTIEKLETTFDKFGSDDAATGLFIAMRITVAEHGAQLSLLPEASSILPYWSMTKLQAPFDDRNLKWRSLFIATIDYDDESDLLSELLECSAREDGDYLTKLPACVHVDGFPQTAIVQFASRPRAGSLVVATVNSDRNGLPYRCALHADEVSASRLAKLDPARLKQLVDWLIDGEQERSFHITAFDKNVSKHGLIRAYTVENLQVQLSAESLSLVPFDDSQSSTVWASREAIGRPRYRQTKVSPLFDVSDVPESAFESNIASGVLTSVPHKSDVPCIVAWRVGRAIEQRPLFIKNLNRIARRRLDLGCRVTIDRHSITPVLTLEEPHLSAETLWRISEAGAPTDPGAFVGTAHIEGKGLCDLFEESPGEVSCVQVPSGIDPVSSRFSATHLTGCSIVGMTDWSGWRHPDTFRHDPAWRVAYAIERRQGKVRYLCGLSRTKRPATGKVRLTGYELEIKGQVSTNKIRIRRRLRARPDEGNLHALVPAQVSSPRVRLQDSEILRRDRALLLTKWRSAPYIEGRHDEERNVFTPSDPFAQRLIPEGITIKPSNFSRRSPSRPTSRYSRHRARILLCEEEPLTGSYLDVPAVGINDLILALGNPPVDAVSKIDELTLCYVGIKEASDGKILHLFEWGYGWWTRLDSEFLRYKGRPIEEGELVLAFGDRIKSIRLMVENDATIISIEDISPAPSHLLYKQARDRILHVLRVSSSPDGTVSIDGLDAFDSRQATSIIRPFHKTGAVIEPGSALAISQHLVTKPNDDVNGQTAIVYGRLDQDKFKGTGGAELMYRAVRTGAEGDSGFDELQLGDRIFVKATSPKKLANDLALRVVPLSDFEKASAQSNNGGRKRRDNEWLVTRRLFSYDESALARITSGTGTELNDRVLLVRLESGRQGHFSLHHRDGAPARSSELLDGLLAQAGGHLFCVFAGRHRSEAKSTMLLEVRPGALIEMERHSVEWPQEALQRGDILRVERQTMNKGAPYRAIFAIYNDRRYARVRRPVVVLPRNPLRYLTPPFENEEAINKALAHFGAGDFRQLSTTLDISEPDIDETAPDVLERFMSLPHPKIAWLQTKIVAKGRRSAVLSPDFGNRILVGRLEFEASAREASTEIPRIRAVPLECGNAELQSLSIQWCESTFLDINAKQILKIVANASWYYHDNQTIVWRRTSENQVIADYAHMEKRDVKTGPLFFEREGGATTLRFRRDQIERHLIGFANLRDYLPPASQPSTPGVVAYTAPSGGLYVELLPGRVYEVPSAMCSSDERDSIALDRLDWSVFGTGDKVGLRRTPSQAGRYGQQGVLLWWKHGIRNAIGPQGALMPKVCLQEHSGGIVYGAGDFITTLPTDPTESLPELAIIGGETAVHPFTLSDAVDDRGSMPPPGTTLLLSLQGAKDLEIKGLTGFIPALATKTTNGEHIDWRMDSLLSNAISQEKDDLKINWERVFERIQLVGGTIPITLETIHVDENDGKKYVLFSRRHQNLRLREYACARASVIGYIAEGDLVVLAVGGRHLEIPFTRVVDGAPKELWCEIIENLAHIKAEVWLQQVGNRIYVGLRDEPSTKIVVRNYAYISSQINENERLLGLVCVGTLSRRLYWLPANNIGATRLTPKQCAAALPPDGPTFEALRLPGGNGISLIEDARQRNEMERLRPGVVTNVRPIPGAIEDSSNALPQFVGPTPGKATLARHPGTGLLISLLLEEDEIAGDSLVPVEIAWRWHEKSTLRLTAVRRGKRRIRFDIPDSLLLKPSSPIDPTKDIVYDGGLIGKETDSLVSCPTQELIERTFSMQKDSFYSLRIALIVLRRLGENSSDAAAQKAFWMLASDIGKRALRSFHLEPLAKRHALLLRGDQQEDVAPGLNRRVEELLNMLVSSSGSMLADQILERLEALVLFATLYPQPDRANHLVHALSGALGGSHDLNVLADGSQTIRQLATLLRPFQLRMKILPPVKRQVLIANTTAVCLKFEEHFAENDFDIPLPRGFTMSQSSR